jgi:hypothetical protein
MSGERGKKTEGSLTAPYSMFAITHPEAEFSDLRFVYGFLKPYREGDMVIYQVFLLSPVCVL